MVTKCLAQGSSGNCWILEYHGEKLLLDAGIPIKRIKQGLDYDLMNVKGVLITHSHKDHSLSSNDLEHLGLEVYKPYEKKETVKTFGSFRVQCMQVPHGDCDCFAFYIKVGNERILYATDFEYIPFDLSKLNLNHVIIECDYQSKYVDKDSPNYNHKILDHCEFETCKEFLQTINTDSLRSVILTHLGGNTVNGREIVDEIASALNGQIAIGYAKECCNYELIER